MCRTGSVTRSVSMPLFVDLVPATSTRCPEPERSHIGTEAKHDRPDGVLDDRGVLVDEAGRQRDDAATPGWALRGAARVAAMVTPAAGVAARACRRALAEPGAGVALADGCETATTSSAARGMTR